MALEKGKLRKFSQIFTKTDFPLSILQMSAASENRGVHLCENILMA
jgi:hypothetical protein